MLQALTCCSSSGASRSAGAQATASGARTGGTTAAGSGAGTGRETADGTDTAAAAVAATGGVAAAAAGTGGGPVAAAAAGSATASGTGTGAATETSGTERGSVRGARPRLSDLAASSWRGPGSPRRFPYRSSSESTRGIFRWSRIRSPESAATASWCGAVASLMPSVFPQTSLLRLQNPPLTLPSPRAPLSFLFPPEPPFLHSPLAAPVLPCRTSRRPQPLGTSCKGRSAT